jgi:hypothetical protein
VVKDCEGIWRKDQLDEIDEINCYRLESALACKAPMSLV